MKKHCSFPNIEKFITMKKHCSFPNIEKFITICDNISSRTRYVGESNDGIPIYDKNISLPILTFTGTVKLHGSNCGVTMSRDGEIYPQSRENLLSIESNNVNFVEFFEEKTEIFKTFFRNIDFKDFDYLTIFGEWCGKGIQNNVAICSLPKMFVVFDIKGSYNDALKKSYYFDENEIKKIASSDNSIYNIYQFETFSLEIDFNNYKNVEEKLNQLTKLVGDECPVGKSFGVSGIGEGIVWSYRFPDGGKIRFKVKDSRHGGKSKIKNKVIKPVDDEKINKINDVVDLVTPTWRLSQMLNKSCDLLNGGYIDSSKLGIFIKMVIEDIIKEDMDILNKNGLTIKDISKKVSNISQLYFFEKKLEQN
jgi:hypothetical protein